MLTLLHMGLFLCPFDRWFVWKEMVHMAMVHTRIESNPWCFDHNPGCERSEFPRIFFGFSKVLWPVSPTNQPLPNLDFLGFGGTFWNIVTSYFWSNYSDLTRVLGPQKGSGLGREMGPRKFQENPGWWNIITWLDDSFWRPIHLCNEKGLLVVWVKKIPLYYPLL